MAKKTIIKSIHKADSFYPYRLEYVGKEVEKSKLTKSRVRGYVAGDVYLKVPDVNGEKYLFFYAVKLEEVDA